MSSLTILTFNYTTKQISIYLDIPMLIIGVIGEFLNLIVFLNLKTFRQNSCTFYLIIMSFVNIIILLTGVLSRITISGFDLDWTQISSFYCKCRVYLDQLSILMSCNN
jgi:heme/copper-type cytochrome/quinol oxidase subunit 4